MSLNNLINSVVDNKMSRINTIMLATVTSVSPLQVVPLFNQKYAQNKSMKRTVIGEPINLDGKIYNAGDVVVIAFLQEVTEDGATRRFDISDAVILGQAQKSGQYSGTARFAQYAVHSEESDKAKDSRNLDPTVTVSTAKPVVHLNGSDGKTSEWSW